MLDITAPVGKLTAGMVGNSPDDVRIVHAQIAPTIDEIVGSPLDQEIKVRTLPRQPAAQRVAAQGTPHTTSGGFRAGCFSWR